MDPMSDSCSLATDTGGRRNIATKWMRPGPWIWKSGKFEINKHPKNIFLKIKSVSPKILARPRLVGKNSSRPHLGQFQAVFSMGQKNTKNYSCFAISLGGPMAAIQLVWGNGCNISPATCSCSLATGSTSSPSPLPYAGHTPPSVRQILVQNLVPES